jgi:hypothetical protein
MKTVGINGYVYFKQYDWEEEGSFVISQYPPEVGSSPNEKFIKSEMFFVQVPENIDMREVKLAALQEEKTKIEAEFAAKVTQINRKINELLAIENQS